MKKYTTLLFDNDNTLMDFYAAEEQAIKNTCKAFGVEPSDENAKLYSDINDSLENVKSEFDSFTSQDATFIFVSNEIGMGGTSDNEIQRRFADLQGWVNQYIAACADEVVLMVAGIPLKIK